MEEIQLPAGPSQSTPLPAQVELHSQQTAVLPVVSESDIPAGDVISGPNEPAPPMGPEPSSEMQTPGDNQGLTDFVIERLQSTIRGMEQRQPRGT
jgi:hypothetical protein